MALPKSFLDIADTYTRTGYYKEFFNNQYPDSDDCIVLDKQARDIQEDIAAFDFFKEEGLPLSVRIPCTIAESSSSNGSGCFQGYRLTQNPEYQRAVTTKLNSKTHLNYLLLLKRLKQTKLDCRNQIETLRQDQTAQIFTETSAQSEARILGDTRKKQYTLAIVVGSVILTSLTVLLIKNNK